MDTDTILRNTTHADPNVRIASIRAIGRSAGRLSGVDHDRIVARLRALLDDVAGDDYCYGFWQCDAESPQIRVCDEAAGALAALGYSAM